MRLIDADKLIDDYNASGGTISDLMELILDAANNCVVAQGEDRKVVHAHIVVDWLGDCRCSKCGEIIDGTSCYCNRCGAGLDEPEQREY